MGGWKYIIKTSKFDNTFHEYIQGIVFKIWYTTVKSFTCISTVECTVWVGLSHCNSQWCNSNVVNPLVMFWYKVNLHVGSSAIISYTRRNTSHRTIPIGYYVYATIETALNNNTIIRKFIYKDHTFVIWTVWICTTSFLPPPFKHNLIRSLPMSYRQVALHLNIPVSLKFGHGSWMVLLGSVASQHMSYSSMAGSQYTGNKENTI